MAERRGNAQKLRSGSGGTKKSAWNCWRCEESYELFEYLIILGVVNPSIDEDKFAEREEDGSEPPRQSIGLSSIISINTILFLYSICIWYIVSI